LVRSGVVPSWNSVENKAVFKKMTKVPELTLSYLEGIWPSILALLEINNETEAEVIRHNVEHILREQGRL
jgi:hypothetical protein